MRKKLVWIITLFVIITSPIFASDWYVRPAGGNYGAENGTSYANAWNGLENVVWGTGGVQGGDNLYICGLHHRKYAGVSLWYIAGPITSGTSNNVRVTLRGDYPGDPGIVWGSGILAHESWAYEGSNTYSITIPSSMYSGWLFEDVTATSWIVLDKEISLANCEANPGSYFSADYITGSKLYVHCSDNGIPTHRISFPRAGYRFDMNGQSYVTFANLKFYALYRMFLDWGNNETGTYLRWDNCTMWYGEGAIQEFRTIQTHHIVINNCDIAWAQNGLVYGPRTGGPDTDCAHDYTVSNCYIHDIGVRITHPDAHGIGVQGGYNGLIEKNTFENCGTGPLLYANNVNQSIKDTVIRWNYVKDTHTRGSATGFGIALNCDGQNNADKSGNEVYGNIVTNCTVGYRHMWAEYQVVFYNNVAYNCDQSFYLWHGYQNIGPNVILRNNISLNPKIRHLYFGTDESEGNYTLDSDYNLFYPISGDLFFFYDAGIVWAKTFAEWQALSKSGCTLDSNSMISNPMFSNASGSYSKDTDFQFQSSSPAIDTGVDVGLAEDYAGTPIPQGFAPDIGAYEYTSGSNPLNANINASPTSGTAPLSVNFTGSASGGTSPYSYSWNFDDGGSSTAQNPSHAFSTSGTYTATLTVTDNESNQDLDTVVISVANPTNPLAALVSASPTSGTAPLSVNFTGSASGGISPYSYSWNFGDGGSSAAQNPSHAYSNAGTFIAILTVTDSSSSQTTDSLTINVSSSAGTQQLSLSSITGGPAPGFGGTTDPTPGSHSYASGSIVALSSIPNTDYRFSEWEGDVSTSNAFNPQFSLNMDIDKDLSAYFCTRCGDVNGDLMVTASDAQGAFDIFLGRNSSPTKCETENADVSCDSIVTPGDAQAIFNKFIMKGELPADCSGKTRALQAQSLSIQAAQLPGTHLIVDDAEVNSNGYVYVPIIIDNPSNIDAFGFDLQFPTEAMEFMTFDVTGLLDEYNQVDAYYTEEGLLRVGGYSGTPLLNDSPEVLITLVFRVKEEATGPLSLVITNTYDDIKNATVKDGTVTIQHDRDPINCSERKRILDRFERLPTLLFIRF